MKLKFLLLCSCITLIFYISFHSCQYIGDSVTKESPADTSTAYLVQKKCGSCHLPVSPTLLDKDTWMNHILPAMAPKLGIGVYGGNQYYAAGNQNKSATSFTDWMKIVRYYERSSPKKLKLAKTQAPLLKDWSIFSIKIPAKSTQVATTVMVAVDTFNNSLYTSEASTSNLYAWNKNLRLKNTYSFPSAVVGASFNTVSPGTTTGTFTSIGMIKPLDFPRGKVLQLKLGKNLDQVPDTVAATLPRPVRSVPADFNKDGLTDWAVCGFGHTQGGLYWYKQLPGHRYEKNIIREIPGATQVEAGDFNHDGWPDIMVLFAQADEGIWLFSNDRKGGFTTKNLIRFPPVFGSTSFQLIDFNHDGKLDILYTSGDNSDYSRILKPYHGVYIYLNQGDFRYKQSYFYPVNGCTKAAAADFDLDGDLDIAAIAFFADLKNKPEENFIYFEQTKPLRFSAHALPLQSLGRWICMDVNDLDKDGDADIVLGNYAEGFLNQSDIKPYWDEHLPFIVLNNNTRTGK